MLHLGGGATAGRLVLTWADGSGAPTHHTKLAPEHLARAVVAEAKALTILAGIPSVAGTVPTLLGLRQGPTWAALTASHLPGRPPRGAPAPASPARVVRRSPAHHCDVDDGGHRTGWRRWRGPARDEPADASIGVAPPCGTPPTGSPRAVASLDDPALQAVVRRGLDLGATSNGLLHGDLWPGNVHLVERGRRGCPDRGPRLGVGPGRASRWSTCSPGW